MSLMNRRKQGLFLFVRALLCTTFCTATGPQILWSTTLPNGGTIGEGLRKGTGVVLSENEQSLWVTSENGGLHVLDATAGGTLVSFQPDNIDEHYTESRSSVSLHHTSQSIEFGVYAIVDVPEHHGDINTPASPLTDDITSRIIALDGDAAENEVGTLRWSTQVDGAVEGTPLISSDGSWVYVISNTALHAILTVLHSSDGSLVSQATDPRPMAQYGPASMLTKNGVDKLYWADANDRGYAEGGRMHVIVSDFLEAGVHSQRSFASSSTVAPTISSDGKKIWIGGRGATIHGWDDDTSLKPVWSTQLSQSHRNESYPIVNTIETDATETRLFVASATNAFHCIDAQNGTVLWSTNSSSGVFLTGAKYAAEYHVVYTMEHLSGTVTQHDAETGDVYWQLVCEDVTMNPLCQASVEADFSLSSDGVTIFYGDIYGRITAVKFPTDPPSEAPSSAPTESTRPSEMPTMTPSHSPSDVPTLSSVPSISSSESPSGLPSGVPSFAPSDVHSDVPTDVPSNAPSFFPSDVPSFIASAMPSNVPTSHPSDSPSAPTERKETRGAGESPTGTGREPEPWRPEEIPGKLPSSAALMKGNRWTFAFMLLVYLTVSVS